MISVTLTADEWASAVFVAALRQHHSLHRNSADSLYEKPWMDQFNIHVLGACGEIAVAKALGLHWGGTVNAYKTKPDVEPDIEVRHRTKSYYDLIVRKDDPDDRRYFLTIGEASELPKISLVGWISGAEAKQDRWLARHGGWKEAYFVPQGELNGVGE